MGCAGAPLGRTPNTDRLAERGTRFTAAYTNSPIYVPARAALATGRDVHETGYWDNAMGYDGRVESWGHVLPRHGHRAESIGKLHFRNASDPTGFSRQINPLHLAGGVGQVWGSVREPPPQTPDKAANMLLPIGAGLSSYNSFDMENTDSACAWIREVASSTPDKPWALFVGLVAPHFPLTVPQEFLDIYPLSRIPDPPLHPRSGYKRHPWVEAFHQCQPVDDSLDDHSRKLATACYYALCSFLDHQIGRILNALEQTRLAETTRVICSSDHGDNLGNRGLWGECTLYDGSARVPLILAGPDVPGVKCAQHRLVWSMSFRRSCKASEWGSLATPRCVPGARSSTSRAGAAFRSVLRSANTMRWVPQVVHSWSVVTAISTFTMSVTPLSCSTSSRTRVRPRTFPVRSLR